MKTPILPLVFSILATGAVCACGSSNDLGAVDSPPGDATVTPAPLDAPGPTDGTDDSTSEPDAPDALVEVAPTFYVSDGFLYDPCGRDVLLRGVNKMSVWTDPRGDSFPEIAATGANTVRIVWSTSASAAGLDLIIGRARDEGLLPMVELHDATGNFAALGQLVDYWVRPDVAQVLQAHERALLVNIGNEVGDWNVSASQFQTGYRSAIDRMRTAGIRAPLVIDSRGWAQDIDFLIENAPALLEHDPQHNVLFSSHFYNGTMSTDFFRDAFGRAFDAGLTLIVGEFADATASCSPTTNHQYIIEAAQEYQVGWYAWSWGPGNNPCASMDMTRDGTFAGLTGWGLEVAVNSPFGIKNTALPIATQDAELCL